MTKKIAILSIIISLLGLASEYISLINVNFDMTLFYLSDFFRFFRLGFFDERNIFGIYDNVNYINVLFYMLFLLGGILYGFNPREVRIVRFIYSVLFISGTLDVLLWSFSFLMFSKDMLFHFRWYWIFIGLIWMAIKWIVYYKFLKYFNEISEPAIIQKEYGGHTSNILVEATKWQRLFNYLIDYVVLFLVFSPILYAYSKSDSVMAVLRTMEGRFGEHVTVWLIIIFCRILYYVTFESIFQASPAKILSETKVTNSDGEKLKTGNVFVRTIIRFIPLEPFSFLMTRGWHDSWSDSYIIQEKRKGIKGIMYFWLIPLIIVLLFGLYKGAQWYEGYKSYSAAKTTFESKAEDIEKELNRLNVNHIVVLRSMGGNYLKYLKTEAVSSKEVTFSILELPQQAEDYTVQTILNSVSQKDIEQIYSETKDTLERITISRRLLAKSNLSFTESPENVYDDEVASGGVDFFNNGSKYYIERVDSYFQPNIKVADNTSHMNSSTMFSIYNSGWTAEILSLKNNLNDGVHWKVYGTYLRGPELNTETIISDKKVEEIDLTLTVKDTLNRRQVYRIYGKESIDRYQKNLHIEKLK